MTENWIDRNPALQALDAEAKHILRDAAVRKQIPRGTVLFRPGDSCAHFPFVLSGSIRVQRLTETGKEIVLYRVTDNETCILTTAALVSEDAHSAEGVAETDVVACILPAERFNQLMSVSASFRALVFDGYARRIAALMTRIEEIICVPVNVRLAERLLAMKAGDHRIETTQQALAADLATAREVVGRALKGFEAAGWVKLTRGGVEILDRRALSALRDAPRD
jgi:CRP/FNR family transcriptional regulator